MGFRDMERAQESSLQKIRIPTEHKPPLMYRSFCKNKARQVFFSLANPFNFQEDFNGLLYRAMQTRLNSGTSANRSKSMEHMNRGYSRKEMRLQLQYSI